jgi:hypothetical protein
MDTLLTLLIVLGFLVIFPLFWTMIVWLISRVGWTALAQQWQTTSQPSGTLYSMVTAQVGFANYRNTLQIHLNQSGIFLEPIWLFRFGHARLFVPWQDVVAVKSATFFRLLTGVRLELQNSKSLTLYGQVAKDLLSQNT